MSNSESKYTNRLVDEKSPYLVQHAHNPVDWLPWGEDAFAKARAENKPIFLSIGYSTCHWCHVMERESFEDEQIAAYLNEHFVPVKVDREERPDVDRVHMTFVQATNNGQGGWPMSVFLTPELKPFYGGTYFPPRDAYGRPGFGTLLQSLAAAWQNDRDNVEASAQQVVEALQSFGAMQPNEGELDWDDILSRSFSAYTSSFDTRWAGFGRAPKFPRPVAHDFLHRVFAATGQKSALEMSGRTLLAMATRGMNDQLGGGFHRYSVDEQWIVSHFEKMLYDQAQLVISLLEAFQMTGERVFASAAQSTLEYVLRDMTHPNGGFFAAEDADSLDSPESDHKEEGAFYVWTQNEIDALLGSDAPIFSFAYGVRPGGNAPASGDPHGEFRGKNILHQAASLDEIASKFGRSAEEVETLLESARKVLWTAREKRPRPHRDEKIIVAWNGLMISAFARGGAILREPRYIQAADRAAAFIRRELWDEEAGTLRRHYKDGAANVPAFADDYAALCRGLLDMWEASGNADNLRWAEWLQGTLDRDFWDGEAGGYFGSAPDPSILVRAKEDYDGAEPSATSLAAQNLLRLHHALDRPEYLEKAESLLRLFGPRLRDIPSAMPALEVAAMMSMSPPQHIVLVGRHDSDDLKTLLSAVHERFVPFATVLVLDETNRAYFEERLPWVRAMTMKDNRATAYVCRDFTCRAPVNSLEELRAELGA